MIVLDTHAWIWWAARPDALSARARDRIREARVVGVPAISCWEVAMLVAKGRLQLDRDVLVWIKQALALRGVQILPITPEIAVAASGLGDGFPGDPADRLIAASTQVHRGQLVTKDAMLRAIEGLPTVW